MPASPEHTNYTMITHTASGFPLTEEQAAVINAPLVPGTIRKVVAGAGTGKSTVLEGVADNNSKESFLYLAFNRSVREKAQKSFPDNTKPHTFNSLAYQRVGVRYQALGGIMNSVGYRPICYKFRVSLIMAASIKVTLENFLNSAAKSIQPEHLYLHPRVGRDTCDDEVLKAAGELWGMMQGGQEKFLGMTHSGCLKLLQLESPDLGFRNILCDESQDTNPVSLDILWRQVDAGASLTLVGDPRQQIYSWRGAVDAMQGIDCEEFKLTHSFRFNKRVAWMANKLLQTYNISLFPLIGVSGVEDFLYNGRIPPDKKSGTHALLARTNVGAFSSIVDLIDQGETVAFNGDVGVFTGTVMDIFHLRMGQVGDVSKFGRLKSYKSYSEFLDICVVDPEMKSLNGIVEKFEKDIPDMVQQISDRLVRDVRFASVMVSTVHKDKGMEHDGVTLADDFAPVVREGKLLPIRSSPSQKRGDVVDLEDLHIMYVAITRAKRMLAIPPTLTEFIELIRKTPVPEMYVPPPPESRHKDAMRGFGDEQFDEEFENEH